MPCLFVCLFVRMMAEQGIPSRALIARPRGCVLWVKRRCLSPLHHLWRCHVSLRPLHGSTAPLGPQPVSSLLLLSSFSHLVTASISSLTSPASQRSSPTSFPALFVCVCGGGGGCPTRKFKPRSFLCLRVSNLFFFLFLLAQHKPANTTSLKLDY